MEGQYLELYKNVATGDYLVQRYAGSTGVGRFLKVSCAMMREKGLGTISGILQSTPPPPEEKPELSTFSEQELKAFYSQHPHIFVYLQPGETICVGPLRKRGSGFVAPKEDVMELARPYTHREFVAAVDRAFAALN